jgi:integrase
MVARRDDVALASASDLDFGGLGKQHLVPMTRPKTPKLTSECFASVIRAFRESDKFKKLADSTRANYGHYFDLAGRPDTLGALSVEVIRPALVQAFLDGLADRPATQKNARAALKTLEKWALVRDLLPRQITLGTEAPGGDGGHIPWPDAMVSLAEQEARPDLARVVTLAANTGQRGSDLIRICPTDIEEYEGRRGINVIQKKTGNIIWIPLTLELATAIDTWERRPGPFLRKLDGSLFTRPQLSDHWDRERAKNPRLAPIREAGLVLHGLRGTACVRLQRLGATDTQIGAMVGMSEQMVRRYCRFSKQRENALAAVHYLDRTAREPGGDKSSNRAH